MTEHEPLPHELAELFAAERSAPVANTTIRAALRTKLGVTAASLTVAKTAAAATLLGTTGKTLAVLALTIAAAGTGAVALVSREQPRVAARSEPRHVEAAVPKPRIEPPAETSPLVETRRDDAPRAATPRRARTIAPSTPSGPTQAQVLKAAWASLSSEPAHALELAQEDQRDHPAGTLAEERDALVVQALANLSRTEDARIAATAFIARYPNSIHRARVERVVGKELP